jgi:hypothetical protein
MNVINIIPLFNIQTIANAIANRIATSPIRFESAVCIPKL